mmetsp:Transcript_12371/g.35594  ORF Transcript_12371/g.35594 Transcript_12371/m.35594 type:complete len:141 (-) Transcript_12371:2132-2554(-)
MVSNLSARACGTVSEVGRSSPTVVSSASLHKARSGLVLASAVNVDRRRVAVGTQGVLEFWLRLFLDWLSQSVAAGLELGVEEDLISKLDVIWTSSPSIRALLSWNRESSVTLSQLAREHCCAALIMHSDFQCGSSANVAA